MGPKQRHWNKNKYILLYKTKNKSILVIYCRDISIQYIFYITDYAATKFRVN